MRPNAAQFGHLGLEIMYGLRLAARLRASLWLIRPEHTVNTALFGLTADGVTIKVFDGWAGRLLTRAFFPDDTPTLQLFRGATVYGTPFYFLVSLKTEVFLRSVKLPFLSGNLLASMDELQYRTRKRASSAHQRLVKDAHKIRKRADKLWARLQRSVRASVDFVQSSIGTLAYRAGKRVSVSAHRSRKGIRRRIKKPLQSMLTDLARRLKVLAADRRKDLTATCLLSIRRACLRLSEWVKASSVEPNAGPAERERTNAEVASGSASNLEQACAASIASPEPSAAASREPPAPVISADTHADARVALVRAPGVEPARPGLASLKSPEDRSIVLAQVADPVTSASADQALAEPGDISPPHERIDLYRVANGLSPARAVTAYMRKVRRVPTYYKRLWLARTPRSRVPMDLLPSLEAQAEKHLGIHPEARLVGLHVRESGFKAGRELHDVKPEHLRNDAVRNVTTANYLPALDFLSRQGFTIVRIGDPTMTPLEHPGVVDLARSPARTDMLEAYCIERAACFIGCESGPVVLACMFQKPHLVLNATDPLAVIPIGAGGIFTFQAAREIATGRMLSPLDMLFPEYLHNVRNTRVFEYRENDQDDVLAAVKDLLEIVECGTGPETPEQREFRLWALGVGVRMRLTHGGVCKWGPHRGYLGGGRIAASFGRKYVGPQLVEVEATALPPPRARASLAPASSLYAGLA